MAEQAADENYQEELTQHLTAHLLCDRRHTITGLLEVLGRQQQDWSKAYRLYEEHVNQRSLFGPILDGALELLPSHLPLVVAVDDSHTRKTGKQVAEAGWYKDPLGPAFHVNLMYAHKFIQISVAVADPNNPKRARMIPVAVQIIPKLPKPDKNATKEERHYYEKIKAHNSPGAHATRLLKQIRQHLDAFTEHGNRTLWVCGDGHYTNATVLQHLPPRTVYLGRTRDDINLRAVPAQPSTPTVGRPLSYGEKLPTPLQLRKDKQIPWETTQIYNGAKKTTVRFKHLPEVKWHVATEKTRLQLIVLAPLRYKKRKDGPWRYTDPAYIICSVPNIPVHELIQAYCWRWGIEVNFKEQKQLFGAGQAQVRISPSVSSALVVCIASYAALLLAGIRTYGFNRKPQSVCPPKWHPRKKHARVTCSDLIKQVRHEFMLRAATNFSPLPFQRSARRTPEKSTSQCIA